DALFIEVNPIPVKEAMNSLGIDVGPARLPLTTMETKLIINYIYYQSENQIYVSPAKNCQ
ncbi:hypothetical protein PV02_12665, partial [Methanolobus chelungpuianus]